MGLVLVLYLKSAVRCTDWNGELVGEQLSSDLENIEQSNLSLWNSSYTSTGWDQQCCLFRCKYQHFLVAGWGRECRYGKDLKLFSSHWEEE